MKPNPASPLRILVDDRERNAPVLALLQADARVEVVVERLEVGDYQVADEAVIERKTVDDFLNSIVDGRLFRQASRLAGLPSAPAFILEGTIRDLAGRHLRREAIQGALLSLGLLFGIPVLRARDAGETAQLIRGMMKWAMEPLRRPRHAPRALVIGTRHAGRHRPASARHIPVAASCG